MNRISLALFFSTILILLFSCDQALGLRKQTKEKQDYISRIDLLNDRGWKLYKNGKKEYSRDTVELALALAKKLPYRRGIGIANKTLGALAARSRQKQLATAFYKKATDAFQSIKDCKEISAMHLLWGNLFNTFDDLDKAVKSYYEGIHITQSCNIPELEAMLYTAVAFIKIQQGEVETADSIYQLTIGIQEKVGDSSRLAVTYYHYANFLSKKEQLDRSLDYYNKAAKIFKAKKNKNQIARIFGGIGNVYLQKGDLTKAMEFYQNSLQLKIGLNDTKGLATSYLQIGNVYFKRQFFTPAEEYFNKCLSITDSLQLVGLKSKMLKSLSKVYEQTGRHPEALATYKQHIICRDIISNEKTRKEIKTIEERFQNDLLQSKTKQQEVELTRNRLISYGSLTILGLSLLIAFLIIRDYKRKRKSSLLISAQKEILHLKEVEQLKQQSELRSLNAVQDGQEIERKRIAEALHNSMGSLLSAIQMHLQSLNLSNYFKKTKEQTLMKKTLNLVGEAARTNRKIAHEMMPPILMMFGLNSALDYLTDKLKMPHLAVTTSVYGMQDRYPEKLELALYRIIDELLNNILKHAKATDVTVQLTEHEGWLNIIVEDNGVGFSCKEGEIKYGMGLNNIQARINHFNGKLSIDSVLDKGTIVCIDVPFQ